MEETVMEAQDTNLFDWLAEQERAAIRLRTEIEEVKFSYDTRKVIYQDTMCGVCNKILEGGK